MKKIWLLMLWFLFLWLVFSWCQKWSWIYPIQSDVTYSSHISPRIISCDEYTIQGIQELGYTGEVIKQGTWCMIHGVQHRYDIPTLWVRIIFDTTFSPYFLDQNKIPQITLQNNNISHDKDHTLTVVKNYTDTLDHYIQDTYANCEYDSGKPIAPYEYQITCTWRDYHYFHNISQVSSAIYDLQYPLWNDWFRFEVL